LAKKTPATWLETLATLAKRNGAVELTPLEWPDDQGSPPTFRVRVLEMDFETLTVERPASPDAASCVGREAPLRVLAIDGRARWEFLTTVIGATAVPLNPVTRVLALKLQMPTVATSAQRRDHFRASTAGVTLEPALVIALPDNPAIPVTSLAERPSFPATVVNISGGGIGLDAPQRAAPIVFKFSRFKVWIDLPTSEQPIEVDASVAHFEPQPGGNSYVGLHFEFGDDDEAKRIADEVCRFSAWQQRQALSREAERA
jgi:hypothetical protein